MFLLFRFCFLRVFGFVLGVLGVGYFFVYWVLSRCGERISRRVVGFRERFLLVLWRLRSFFGGRRCLTRSV